jgi:hypothetical protein
VTIGDGGQTRPVAQRAAGQGQSSSDAARVPHCIPARAAVTLASVGTPTQADAPRQRALSTALAHASGGQDFDKLAAP